MSEPAVRAAAVRLERLSKSFDGTTRAVDAVDLSIAAGEFFALLGPSGCGKTTTLRMIAGFETPDEGRIHVGGVDITGVPVHRRNMGMIFQSYALFPHRTVAENVAFGLRMRGLPRRAVADAVARALKQVALAGYEHRRPAQLSGGEQQRVALARAIVVLQFELKQLQKDLGVTLIFVTHDQEEAMAMSNRMAVMNAGRIEQAGTPADVYSRPRTRFVADFIGEINLFTGEWRDGAFYSGGRALPANGPGHAGGATIAVRPERMRFAASGEAVFSGIVESANYLGAHVLYRIAADGAKLLVKQTGGAPLPAGTAVGVAWNAADAVALQD